MWHDFKTEPKDTPRLSEERGELGERVSAYAVPVELSYQERAITRATPSHSHTHTQRE